MILSVKIGDQESEVYLDFPRLNKVMIFDPPPYTGFQVELLSKKDGEYHLQRFTGYSPAKFPIFYY